MGSMIFQRFVSISGGYQRGGKWSIYSGIVISFLCVGVLDTVLSNAACEGKMVLVLYWLQASLRNCYRPHPITLSESRDAAASEESCFTPVYLEFRLLEREAP